MREDFADVHTAARQELSPYEGWIEEPLMETNHGHRLAYFARGDEAVVISEGPSDPSIIVIRVSRKATIEDHVLWFVSGRREYR